MPSEKQVLGCLRGTPCCGSHRVLPDPLETASVNSHFQRENPAGHESGKEQGGLFHPSRRNHRFFLGNSLAVYTSLQWSLIVSGKPVAALVPYFIVGFEFTILFAVFGNIVG